MGNDKTFACQAENVFAMIDCDRIPKGAQVYVIAH